MPLDEIALEELGLAPRWVRKGAAAGQAGQAGQAGARDDERAAGAAPELTAATVARSSVESVTQSGPAGRVDVADAAAEDAPALPVAKRAVAHAPEPEAFAEAPVSSARAAAEPRQAGLEEPPPLTEDDFAWFDAAPEPSLPHDPAPARTPRDDVATLDWDALAERVASCTRCRLCEKRTNTVFGVGDRSAEWMLIGEAPGENEDRLGEPFVGQAGKLLDNMLRSLSLARGENVYIANVIKCRPPGNRNPEPDEVARCEPYLQRQVALVKPKIILALGRFAAQSLLRTEGSIASLRGRVHEYEGVPVIVSYHPAYLLRSLHDKSKAWADLCLARDTWHAAGGGKP